MQTHKDIEKGKLQRSMIPKHLRRWFIMRLDAANHCFGIRTLPTSPFAKIITAGVRDMSMNSKTDRRRVRRVAEAMITECDKAEKLDD